MDIESIIKHKEAQIADEKLVVSAEAMKEKAADYHRIPLDLGAALKKDRLALIAPMSKSFPETGATKHRFRVRSVGREFEKAGCDALMVCTEATRYLGETEYIEEAREGAHIPVVMHDYIVDSYQIYQALVLGADGVVFMTSVLPEDTLEQFARIADECGLQWIVQVETFPELKTAVQCGAKFIMIRNLDDLTNMLTLSRFIPENIVLIAEGAMKSVSDLETAASVGADAALPAPGFLTPANCGEVIAALSSFEAPKVRRAPAIELKKKPDPSIDFPSLKDVP